MNETRRRQLTFWLGVSVSISTIAYNIVKMWKVFRDDAREETEHNIRIGTETMERFNRSLRKMQSFNEEKEGKYERNHILCKNCKHYNENVDTYECTVCMDNSLYVNKNI